MFIIGIDPMVHCGVALLEVTPDKEYRLDVKTVVEDGKNKKLDTEGRVKKWTESIKTVLPLDAIIFVERPTPRGHRAESQMLLQAAVYYLAGIRGASLVYPHEVKSVIGAGVAANKELLKRLLVLSLHNTPALKVITPPKNDHEVDAICIALLGFWALTGDRKLTPLLKVSARQAISTAYANGLTQEAEKRRAFQGR